MKLLSVDFNHDYLNGLERFLRDENREIGIDRANSAEEALHLFRERQYDGIVTDHDRLGEECIHLLEKIRRDEDSSVPFLILSSEIKGESAVRALNLDADRYLDKKEDLESTCSQLASAVIEEVEHRENAERLVELNSLLMSIRNIDRLIVEEGSVSSLMRKSSEVLLETGGYLNVEIALSNRDGHIEPFVSSGEHEHRHWKTTQEGKGDAPECVRRALKRKSSIMVRGKEDYCKNCPYPEDEINHYTVLIPMESDGDIFGLLIVCHKPDRVISQPEVNLLEEVAEDLSFARKKILTEEMLEEERDLFVKGSTILFKWKAGEEWPIEYVSPNVEDLLGYSQEELIDGDIAYSDFLPPRDLKQVEREVERHIDMGAERINHRPYRLRKKNGDTLWVKDHSKIVRDEDGEIKYYMGYIVDITDQKQTEEALQKSEERYRRLFETAKDGILILKSDTGEIKDANPYIRDILGYSLDELQEKKLWEIESFEHLCKSRKRFKELKEEGYVRHEDIPLETKDGEEIPVEFISNVYRAGGEEVIQCNIREISQRKEAERELEKKHRLLQNLLANAPGMAYRCLNDEDYTMKFLSQGCKELTGYHHDDLIDNKELSYVELILPEDREKVRSKIDQAVGNDERYQVTYRIKTAEEGTKWVWERGKGIEGADDEIYLEGIIMDITERKEATDRERFLHTILRHDVGNKIQALKGYLKLLRERYEDEELVEKASEVLDEAKDIINKLEKMNRVEQKEEIYVVSPHRIIKSCLSKHEPYLEDTNVELEVEDKDIQVKAGELLEILFSNLLENSLRHSECDEIRIRVLPDADEVLMIFEDDGVGIPDDIKENIFDRGFKEGGAGGSGLGMYLVKKIVDNYEGSVEIKDSELGGARFDIRMKKA